MIRSKYIYLVHPKRSNDPVLAVFTVKKEAKKWAESSRIGLDALVCTRMRDGGDNTICSSRVLVPWEGKDVT